VVLIFGGVYQGKLDYALNQFGLSEDEIHRCRETDTDMPNNAKAVYEIDRWILALIQASADVNEKIKQFALENPDAIVIGNDISCGVVPVDPMMRAWRDAVGRSLGILAQQSDEVVRLYCGIPTKLK